MGKSYDLVKLGVLQTRPELLETCQMLGLSWSNTPFEKRQVTAGQALFIWFNDVLKQRRPFDETGRRLMMNQYRTKLVEAGDAIESALEKDADTLPVYLLSVADNTMIGMTGTTGWLDLRIGDTIPNLPQQPIEVVSYNLTGLFIAMDKLYVKRGDINARRVAREPK